jgi:hypothetical protein
MSLYHYTKFETLIEYILPSKSLKSNSLNAMNDPRESHAWSFGSINLPLERFFPGYYSNETHIDCQMKFGQMIKERFQVICFSGAQQKGWNNEMMWAHYADNQRGVCLEFDEDKLLKSVKENFPQFNFELQNVNYEKKKKEKPWIVWDDSVSTEQNFDNFLAVLCDKVVFHKSHFWEKEDEKRLLFLNHMDSLFLPYMDSLKAIHIGLGFPRWYVPAIENLIDGLGIKLYTLIYQRDEYVRWRLTRKDGKSWTSIDDDV